MEREGGKTERRGRRERGEGVGREEGREDVQECVLACKKISS